MKRYLFAILTILVSGIQMIAQPGLQKVQTIDALDTVVFDLSQVVISGNHVTFPVSILSDDSVYALDFSLKYNQANLDFDTIIDLTNYLQSFSFFNTNDSTLRYTSSSLQAVSNDTPLVSIGFAILGTQINNADLNNLKAYLNGTQCSIKLINVGTTGLNDLHKSDHSIKIYPNPSASSFKMSFDEEFKSNLTINLYDLSGKYVSTLENKNAGVGYGEFEFNISKLGNGLYIAKIFADWLEVGSKKITVIHE